jgi:D-threo-aldose 1-dehydrogenase
MDESFQVPATHRRVWDFSRDGIVRSVDDSLARTGVSRIDVLFLHDAEKHFEAALRDGYPALDDLLPACAERGISVLAASVFNSGVLAAARPAAGAHYDYEPASAELLRRVQRIADVCEAHGVTLPQAAMAFPLRHPVVAGIVVGMRSAAEARRNAESFRAEIPAQVWADLRGEGLLDQRAPVST